MAPQNIAAKKTQRCFALWFPKHRLGCLASQESDTIDSRTVDYCIQALLQTPKEQPLFLACGIFEATLTFFCTAGGKPEGLSKMPLPERKKEDDLGLTFPLVPKRLMSRTKWFWTGIRG